MSASTAALLRVSSIDVAYGEVQVLWNVSLDVFEGEIVALVGANGAGKSTLLSTISGLLQPSTGTIEFAGKRIDRASTQRIVDLGIAHVPEGRRLFQAMSVRDQLLLGAFRRNDRQGVARDLERVLDIFPRLKERVNNLGGYLSGGEQQMVAIARGLASCPRLLMLDEPSMGLAPIIADQIFDQVERIHREQGIAILLVEQRVAEALSTCDHGYVLESGRIVLAGTHDALLADPRVKQAYLGA